MACGIGHVMNGETVENISKGIDTYSYRVPLGVCAGICPFNFPAMIPVIFKYKTLIKVMDVPNGHYLWKHICFKTQ
jgi:hypothetical protein